MNSNKNELIKEYIQTLAVVHKSLVIGVGLMAGVMMYLVKFAGSNLESEDSINNIFMIIAPLFMIGTMLLSIYIYKISLKRIKANEDTLEGKLNEHRSSSIIRYAIIEGGCFIGIVAFYITGIYTFWFLAIFQVIMLYNVRPTVLSVIEDLELVD